jgi:hypothetical protein
VRDPGARVLLCFGDEDDFTGVEAYDEWAEALGKLAVDADDADGGDRGGGEGGADRHQEEGEGEDEEEDDPTERGGKGLEVVKVPGASHFWGGQPGGGLIEAVIQFLTQGEGDGGQGSP